MRFTPVSEQEANPNALWPEGEVDFEVTGAEERISKAGNEMVALTIQVFNNDGAKRTVYDYLVSNVQFKVRGFCEATGMLPQYDAGELSAEDMIGKTGRLKLGVRKDDTGQYGDKNDVKFYLKAKAAPRRSIAQPAKREPATAGGGRTMQDLNDEIPFGPCWQ